MLRVVRDERRSVQLLGRVDVVVLCSFVGVICFVASASFLECVLFNWVTVIAFILKRCETVILTVARIPNVDLHGSIPPFNFIVDVSFCWRDDTNSFCCQLFCNKFCQLTDNNISFEQFICIAFKIWTVDCNQIIFQIFNCCQKVQNVCSFDFKTNVVVRLIVFVVCCLHGKPP